MARMGALPVPVQIITMCERGWLGIRKELPNGPTTWTLSPTFRSHTKLEAMPRTALPSWSVVTRFTVSARLL
ncbi:hypothetical protein D3C71_1245320 [compost metagenome]